MSPIIELVDHPKFPQIECTGTRNTVSTYAVYYEESTATHPRFLLVPYYPVTPKVVATSLAHAAARMTKAKFVLQTMMLRNLALKAFFPGKKSMGVVRC